MEEVNTGHKKTRLAGVKVSRLWWILASAVAVGLILGLGTLQIIRLFILPLELLIFGITLAAALSPIVSWLERRVPRWAAVLIVYLVLILLIGGLIALVTPPLIDQVNQLSAQIPSLLNRGEQIINQWTQSLSGDTVTNTILSNLRSIIPTLLRLPLTITSALFGVILVLFISFYMLLEAPDIHNFLLSLFPEERRERVSDVVISMADAMGGYMRGVAIDGFILGVFSVVGLLIIGIDFPLVLGVLSGLMEIVPVLGPIITGILITGIAFLQSPTKALAGLIFVIIIQQLENHILVPNVMRTQTNISPLTALLAVFAGGVIGGLLGALVAIPVAAALRVLIRKVIAPQIRSATGAQEHE